MTIRTSLYLKYAGEESNNYGIIHVNTSSGMQEETFVSGREIQEVKITGRDKPYFQKTIKDKLKIKATLAFEDTWDEDQFRAVKRWLMNHDYYQPLIFSDEPEKVYYALVVDEPTLSHNGLNQGYIEVKFECSDPYAYSTESVNATYEWDESPLSFSEADFSKGTLDNLVLNNQGQITINQNHVRWINLSPTLTWNEL